MTKNCNKITAEILNFFIINLLLLWVIFALLDPDPDPQTRLNPDPGPQPWFGGYMSLFFTVIFISYDTLQNMTGSRHTFFL
jgi:hypothetical protein